jgi:NADPH:quinone reductase-like Zn-dependent oxidoreductase
MLALVATGNGYRAERREVEEPQPRADEAIVAVRAISLNRGEVTALGSATEGARLGWDVAGEVTTPARDGTGPREGARVVGLARSGGWAERVALRTHMLAPIPDALSFESASTIPVAGLTAWRALQAAEVVNDKRVLVTGASGGVGRFAVQLAGCHLGAHVTAVVGSAARGEGLRDLGAEEVVVGMPSRGEYDVILESVGGASLARSLELVASRGWIVAFGTSSHESTTFDIGPFFRKGGAHVYGLAVFEEMAHHRSGTRDLGYLADLMAHGALDAQIGLVTGWTDADRAFDSLMGRQVRGKAVLRVE